MIDNLKSVCANYGLGNDGNEFKIITQVFLYKFLNDKFRYAVKKEMPKLAEAENFSVALKALAEDDYSDLIDALDPNIPRLQPEHLISHLFVKQNDSDFAKLFDDTLRQVSIENADVFSVNSFTGAKDTLFDEKIAGSFHMTPGRCYDEAPNGNQSAIHWDLVCIQRPEYGGGEIYLDGVLVRKDGRFVLPELAGLNPENLK